MAPEVREAAEPGAAPAAGGYGRGARILSIGIASTGLVTFAYFSVAAHVLSDEDYGAIALLWSILFISLSVMYRPVEQLLARTIAARRARGEHDGHPLRRPLAIQLAFAAVFVALVLGLRGPLEDALGAPALFWVLLAAAVAYAASYFARGVFAGQQWFGLYGGLVFFEAAARVLFPLAVLAGLARGQTAVALGIAAAPLASLLVVPWALRRRAGAGAARPDQVATVPTRAGEDGRFAGAVSVIQLSEQALLNAAVLLVPAGAAAGIVFNAFLITRVPLQLFQSVQTSLLPHLAGLEATAGRAAFDRAIRVTLLAVAGFAAAVALGLLALGPLVMDLLLPAERDFGRLGLAVIAVGMGFHLAAGTLNQAALARGRATAAAGSWLACAGLFVAWMAFAPVGDDLARAQAGYAGATAVLCLALWALERSAPRVAARDAQ